MQVTVSEEAADRTRVRVVCEAAGAARQADLAAFVAERAGVTRGWTGSFDALEAVLDAN